MVNFVAAALWITVFFILKDFAVMGQEETLYRIIGK